MANMKTIFWSIALLSLHESRLWQTYPSQVAKSYLIGLTGLQVEPAPAWEQPPVSQQCNQFSFGFSLNLAMLRFILARLYCWSLSEVTHGFADCHWHHIHNTFFVSASENVSCPTSSTTHSSYKMLEQGCEISRSWFSAGTFSIFKEETLWVASQKIATPFLVSVH